MFIVNTCWVYDSALDGSTTLKKVAFSELKEIKARNRTVPREERRYFIEDFCVNGSVCECLNLEVSHEQYKLWRRNYRAHTRGLHAEAEAHVTLVSLDACLDAEERNEFGDIVIPPVTNQEEQCVLRMDLERFWISLNDAGKRYLCDMLAYYHENNGVWGSGVYLSKRYGVSRRMVSEYHAELRKIAERELGAFV